MAFTFFEKQYEIETGLLKIRIDYDKTHTVYDLDFNLVSIAKEKFGYEDDDELTFYPNSWELEFNDPAGKNYHVLKLSLGEFEAALPENYTKYGGVTIWKNNIQIFKGYIDPLTLQQDPGDGDYCKFEVLDTAKALKDQSVEQLLAGGSSWNLSSLIWEIYKKVYPNLQHFVTGSTFFSNGIYFKHDWIFKGEKRPYNPNIEPGEIVRNWASIAGFYQTYFNFESMGFWGDSRPAKTYADLIKLIALQFGMSIGSLGYNKVYMVKRFNQANANPISLDGKIYNEPKRYLHLPQLHGIRNKNNWTGTRYYTSGSVQTLNGQIDGELKYPNLVKEFETYVGSYQDPGIGSGTCIFTASQYAVFKGVTDPALNFPEAHIGQIIAQWMYKSRVRPKDRLELTADGLNYNIFDYYKFTEPGNPTTIFRPMQLEKDHIEDETIFNGIEV